MANPKIIVISPDRYQAGKMVACLQDAGYQVASSGMAVRDLGDLCRASPDMLLLEWQLPDSEALHLVRGIRQDATLRRLPVILWARYPRGGSAAGSGSRRRPVLARAFHPACARRPRARLFPQGKV